MMHAMAAFDFLFAASVWSIASAPAAHAAAASTSNGEPDGPKPPTYEWAPFANWDCVSSNSVVDWDMLYNEVVRGLRAPEGNVNFVLPQAVVDMLQNKALEGREECPLGTLYFLVLYTIEVIAEHGGSSAVMQAEALVREMRNYPFFIIAGSRWPTYEALNHFSHLHMPQNEKAVKNALCEGVRGESGINWDTLLQASQSWSDQQLSGLEPGEGNTEYGKVLKDAADAVYKDPQRRGAFAQEECPFGFLFLCTTQVLAAAVRLTGSFEPWARAVDQMLAELPYFIVAGSKWPTYRILTMLSSLSKGEEVSTLGSFQGDVHRWGGTHPASKRFRQYGDLRLSVSELCPLGRDTEGWLHVDMLASLNPDHWYAALVHRRLANVRPGFGEALDAALSTVRSSTFPGNRECGFSGISSEACRNRGCFWSEKSASADPQAPSPQCRRPFPSRKLVAVTFVWGERWAPLVLRFAAWATRLRLGVIIVAMGEACRRACQSAAAALGGANGGNIACWDPLLERNEMRGDPASFASRNAERGSILQRHAMVHLLLHLGVDVIAFDFDTFLFSDPRLRLEAIAEEHDADILMTRHLDADCLNMGLIYVRASSRTAEWYSRYLEWLHQHPFEREQRGANAFLGFTGQRVSFMPKALPRVKALALDDANEFVSSRGGWLGNWDKLIFFHWVNPVQTHTRWADIKILDLRGLYEAALHQSTDILAAGGSLARLLASAEPGTLLGPAREMLETMRVPVLPPRQDCW